MKKVSNYSGNIIKITTSAILAVFVFTMIGSVTTNAQTLMDTGAATSIGATVDAGQTVNTGSIRNKIRADIEAKIQNLKNNQDARNIMVEKRILGSTTPNGSPMPQRMIGSSTSQIHPPMELRGPEDRNMRPGMSGARVASTTRPFIGTTSPQIPRPEIRGPKPGIIVPGISTTSFQVRLGEPGERREPMNFDMFRQRKENAAKQFEVAVNNLKNLRERIGSRIEKEAQNGKDMSKAKLLLGVADTKLAALKSAMDTLKAYTPVKTDCEVQPRVANSTSTPRGSKDCINQREVMASTTTVNLDAARTLVENVQKAIKASQKALNDVVVEIAHSLGFKLGNPNENTSSPTPSTSPTDVPQGN